MVHNEIVSKPVSPMAKNELKQSISKKQTGDKKEGAGGSIMERALLEPIAALVYGPLMMLNRSVR